jgi:hypothetical protein
MLIAYASAFVIYIVVKIIAREIFFMTLNCGEHHRKKENLMEIEVLRASQKERKPNGNRSFKNKVLL